jgi:hypothetical protein
MNPTKTIIFNPSARPAASKSLNSATPEQAINQTRYLPTKSDGPPNITPYTETANLKGAEFTDSEVT